jgi:hypothetical protein
VWSEYLRQVVPGLTEEQALEAVYRFVGYDGMGMPTKVGDFMLGDLGVVPGFATNHRCEFENVPLKDLLLRDIAKANLYLPDGLPSYPIIQGGGAPHDWPRELIEAVIEGAKAMGQAGVMLQGTRSLASVAF